MRYKLLAIDVDDTLIGSDLKISEETFNKIQEAKQAGVQVVIATGRMFKAIIPFLNQLDLPGPAIVYNGAMVKCLADTNPIAQSPIPVEDAREIAKTIEELGFQLNAYLNDQLYVRKRTAEVLRYMERTGVDSIEVGPIGEFLEEAPTKLLVIHYNRPEIEELKLKLRELFGDRTNITGSKPYFIEITAKGISKKKALADLASSLGIKAEEVIAIGDGLNDLEMVKWAGLGVAVANAHRDLKNVADYITGSCNDNGVAQVIEKFIIGNGD